MITVIEARESRESAARHHLHSGRRLCSGNPGSRWRWGAILQSGDHTKVVEGRRGRQLPNNRTELMAAISGAGSFKAATPRPICIR